MNGLKCDLSPSRGARGRARSVQIVDCCVHTSTAGLGVTSPFDADAAVQKKEEEEEGVVD